jgi:hypothetical protein
MIFKLKYSWFLSLLIVLITTLSLTEKIGFGNGLGDIIFIMGIIGCLIASLSINVYFTKYKTKTKGSKVLNLTTWFLTLIIIYYIYSFTIGRGMEYQWNGEIFK